MCEERLTSGAKAGLTVAIVSANVGENATFCYFPGRAQRDLIAKYLSRMGLKILNDGS
jgi:hypothetical protein